MQKAGRSNFSYFLLFLCRQSNAVTSNEKHKSLVAYWLFSIFATLLKYPVKWKK